MTRNAAKGLRKILAWAAAMLLTQGCGQPPRVDADLRDDVFQFLEECSRPECMRRWKHVEAVMAVPEGYVDGVPGRVGAADFAIVPGRRVCNRVRIATGKIRTRWQLSQVVWHELGHCLLHLDHGQGRLMDPHRILTNVRKGEWAALRAELWRQ